MAKHSPARRRFDRLIGYRLEAVAVILLTGLFRRLPLDTASALGGRLARWVGPRLGSSRKTLERIRLALPPLTEGEARRVLADSWENLGRTLAEYVHLDSLRAGWAARVTMTGAEHVAALAADGRPGVTITGHFANWELAGIACAVHGLPLTFVYREPNNPHVARRLAAARAALGGSMVPKGRQAARGLITALRAGGHAGLLIDQKLNEGIELPFLGRPAMTGTVMADLALKFDAPVVPIRVTRLRDAKGRLTARFRVEAFPPLDLTGLDQGPDGVATAMGIAHTLLESWIRDEPGQWMWQHRRWKD
ncbi:MAG: putative lipid biosynthesis lauroyl acyltransferase [Pseudomonadota bacterium]|jgi:KDO2-lipid IV(A) lauroyltransferase